MKKLKRLMIVLVIFILFWVVLTFWAEREGPSRKLEMGNNNFAQTALVVYDPDPFYNLDQQVCESFARGLNDKGWKVIVATVSAAKKMNDTSFQLYVFCANTYNWSPDWAVTRFMKQAAINDKNVVAITLGAGSTDRSQRVFERIIKDKQAKLIDSKTFWLWRPNDQSRLKEPNVKVAIDITRNWGNEIATRLQ